MFTYADHVRAYYQYYSCDAHVVTFIKWLIN